MSLPPSGMEEKQQFPMDMKGGSDRAFFCLHDSVADCFKLEK